MNKPQPMAKIWQAAALRLQQAGIDTPLIDARLLIQHVLGISREQLLRQRSPTLSEEQIQVFNALIDRRANREPMSHILGMREFYGREFKVSNAVLDPRPDTETLIDAVLKWTVEGEQGAKKVPCPPSTALRLLDVGTGTGCILLTLLAEIAHAEGVAVDISSEALEIARFNAEKIGVSARTSFVLADMRELEERLNSELFDVIVSNPPYIPCAEIAGLMPEVRDFEPHLALDGGKDGLDMYRNLAKNVSKLLKPQGLVFLEIGDTQATDVVALFSAAGFKHQDTIKDLAGRDRVVIFKQ